MTRCFSTVGIHQESESGDLKAPPRRESVQWVIKSWERLTQDMIKINFVTCVLTCATNGSEDDEITCFKGGQTCSEGWNI